MSIIDRRLWSPLGARASGIPFIWAEWNAHVLPCLPDAAARERLEIAQRRAAQLCTADSYPQTGLSHHRVSCDLTHPALLRLQFNTTTTGIVLNANDGQEVLTIAKYLRLKHFGTIQVSQAVTKDFPDLQISTGLEIIAGLLHVPLS
jgi:hypothetical protein